MTTATITTTITIPLDIETGAKWFSGLDDDQMARFFVAVAEEAKTWPGHAQTMWLHVGEHLATCECSTPAAQDMITDIADFLRHKRDGRPLA